MPSIYRFISTPPPPPPASVAAFLLRVLTPLPSFPQQYHCANPALHNVAGAMTVSSLQFPTCITPPPPPPHPSLLRNSSHADAFPPWKQLSGPGSSFNGTIPAAPNGIATAATVSVLHDKSLSCSLLLFLQCE